MIVTTHSSFEQCFETICKNPLNVNYLASIVAFSLPSISWLKGPEMLTLTSFVSFPWCWSLGWSLCDYAGRFSVVIHQRNALHTDFMVVVALISCLLKFWPSSSIKFSSIKPNWTLAGVNLSSGVSMVDYSPFLTFVQVLGVIHCVLPGRCVASLHC